MKNLVLFDLDNTLLMGDSDYEWARFLVSVGAVDGKTYAGKSSYFFEQYKAGTLNIDEFLAFQLSPLTRFPRRQLNLWRDEFIATHIQPLISTAARALVTKHSQDTDALCAIVTATNSFITWPIACALGIHHLIATIAACDAQHSVEFTGAPRGLPAFREGKIKRIDDWLESLGLAWADFATTTFYSDSLNDLPLLERSSHPVAVDPDKTLYAHAKHCGWPVISLREKPLA